MAASNLFSEIETQKCWASQRGANVAMLNGYGYSQTWRSLPGQIEAPLRRCSHDRHDVYLG